MASLYPRGHRLGVCMLQIVVEYVARSILLRFIKECKKKLAYRKGNG